MAGEQIVLTVAPDGSVHAETKGMQGKRCLDAVELLEDLLAAETVSSTFTADYEQTSNEVADEVDDEQRERES